MKDAGIRAGLALLAATAVLGAAPVKPFENAGPAAPRGRLDELVFARLKDMGLAPARPCSDEVFLRRVYLDAIGVLPTEAEARAFLADSDPTRRDRLIEDLMQREEFAEYWTLRWADLLRLKAEFPINLWPKATQAYYRWIAAALARNRPYDRLARELLLATGSNFYVPEVNFYRAMTTRDADGIAQAVALTFLGARTESWTADQRAGLAAFFAPLRYKGTSEWKEQIVYLDPAALAAGGRGRFPDGRDARWPPGADPRAAFADWLTAPENPWFARNAVNRIWYWLFGRGIVHEPDDLRPDNPPTHPAALAHLEQEFRDSGWDPRHIYRLILRSSTYQLSSLHPAAADPRAAAHFAYYAPRRLEAEVLIDALCRITGTVERYVSPVPEPFTYVPEELRTVSIPDGNSSSAFLELFGRPARDSGLASERNNLHSAGQRLHLMNSRHVHQKLTQGPAMVRLAVSGKSPREMVETLYLTILSRHPTVAELQALAAYPGDSGLKGRDVMADTAWALVNSEEFLHRH